VDRTGHNVAGLNNVFQMNEEHRVGKRGFNKSKKKLQWKRSISAIGTSRKNNFHPMGRRAVKKKMPEVRTKFLYKWTQRAISWWKEQWKKA
jgi:hypothetical protein